MALGFVDTTIRWEVRFRRGEIGQAMYAVLLMQQALALIKIASLAFIRSGWEEST